jgi:hypothetical protein
MTEVPDEIFTGLIRAAEAEYGFAINPHRFGRGAVLTAAVPAS